MSVVCGLSRLCQQPGDISDPVVDACKSFDAFGIGDAPLAGGFRRHRRFSRDVALLRKFVGGGFEHS